MRQKIKNLLLKLGNVGISNQSERIEVMRLRLFNYFLWFVLLMCLFWGSLEFTLLANIKIGWYCIVAALAQLFFIAGMATGRHLWVRLLYVVYANILMLFFSAALGYATNVHTHFISNAAITVSLFSPRRYLYQLLGVSMATTCMIYVEYNVMLQEATWGRAFDTSRFILRAFLSFSILTTIAFVFYVLLSGFERNSYRLQRLFKKTRHQYKMLASQERLLELQRKQLLDTNQQLEVYQNELEQQIAQRTEALSKSEMKTKELLSETEEKNQILEENSAQLAHYVEELESKKQEITEKNQILTAQEKILQTHIQELEASHRTIERNNEQLKAQRAILAKQLEISAKAQEAFRQSEQKLFNILDRIPVGIFVIDSKGIPYFRNRCMNALLNISSTDLACPTVFDYNKAAWFVQGSDSPYPFNDFPIHKALHGESARTDDVELRVKGKAIPLEVIASPIFDAHNNLKQVVCVMQDITQRRNSERILKKAFDELIASEKELRKNTEELQISNENLVQAKKRVEIMFEREKKNKEDLSQTLKELRQAQAQLLFSEKMASLGQLTAGIAHEINNPINFVYAGIAALESNIEELQSIKHTIVSETQMANYNEIQMDITELLKDIKEGSTRTIEIVKGLRNFSRLDHEQKRIADVHEGLNSTLVLLKNQTKHIINIRKNYDPALPHIHCYPGLLNQVFMNMLSNAIHAVLQCKNNTKWIEIATQNCGENVSIKIKDNGNGIPKEIQNRIFEPFFTTKEIGEGTGLGMSISYSIIKKHKGSIHLSSEENKGTCFEIILPKYVESTS
ncbi:MAG: PAS domain-containing protein [Bernardetiaceae bacterium]|nr:PAS domain-containing protein [Bernardetiaceae bacterium]